MTALQTPPDRSAREDEVRPFPHKGDDHALVRALRRGDPGAPAQLYDRFAERVQRILARTLGPDPELPDLLHEVFAEALTSIHKLDDPGRLAGWLTTIAVFRARGRIRRRRRGRWLRFFAPEELPEAAAEAAPLEARSALARTYRVIDELGADDRVVFTLRFIDGMELTEVAEACGFSLATAKRRLARARQRFVLSAKRDPVLQEWIEGGSGSWTD